MTALFLRIRPKGEADDLGIMYDDEGATFFPSLASCSRLMHVMLSSEADVTVEPEQLPPRLKTIWVQQTESRL